MKRAFDLVVGTVLVLVALPTMVVLAIVSAVALRAWPLFVQERIGRDGRPFRFVKIRTLPTSVNSYVDKYQLDIDSIPAVMRWMRARHLDELPQLFLVALGKMSLVGPRPEMALLHESMDDHHARQRVSLRPGCTGMWQISVDCGKLISEAPEYDRFYLENRSIRLDLWIMARTVAFSLFRGRHITLDEVPRWVLPANATADDVAYREPELALEGVVD